MKTAINLVELKLVQPTQSTPIEAMNLAQLEGVIAAHLHTYIDVGLALARIKDEELYKKDDPDKTWNQYCRERWGFAKSYANYQIEASRVTATMVAKGLPAPSTERACRALSKVPEQDRPKVWAGILQGRNADEVTAKEVIVAVSKHVEKPAPRDAEAKKKPRKTSKKLARRTQSSLPGRLRKQLRWVVHEFVTQRVREFDESAVAEDLLNSFELEVVIAFDDMLASLERLSRTQGAQDTMKTRRRGLVRACEILQIKPPPKGATIDIDEARRKHRKLSARFHPDRTSDNEQMTAQFHQIQEAWEIIRSHQPQGE